MLELKVGKKSGFTLVELLVVIVVIGILATIGVVSYNGIQTRASNTQTITATKKYFEAYYLYALDNGGQYPAGHGCLGDGYPTSRCLMQTGSTAACWGLGAGSVSAGVVINEAIKPYLGGRLPQVSMQNVSCGGTSYVGTYANRNASTGILTVYMILNGDQSCPDMGPNIRTPLKSASGGGTRCYYIMDPFTP